MQTKRLNSWPSPSRCCLVCRNVNIECRLFYWLSFDFCVVFVSVLFCYIGVHQESAENGSTFALYTCIILGIMLLLLVLLLARQPQSTKDLSFKVCTSNIFDKFMLFLHGFVFQTIQVPLVPLIPCLSILLNIYLMMKLDVHTWIRFSIWLLIGLFIYVFYSMEHSVEGQRQREEPKKVRVSAASVNPISTIKL